MEEHFKETIPEEMLEHDEIVRIPPRKRYALNIRVKEIRKAAPRIVEPDESYRGGKDVNAGVHIHGMRP